MRRQTHAGNESPALVLFEFQEKTRALGGSISPNTGSTIQSHSSVLKKTARIIRYNTSTTPSSTTKATATVTFKKGRGLALRTDNHGFGIVQFDQRLGYKLGNREMFVRFLAGIRDFNVYQGCRRQKSVSDPGYH
jgi:hypothetical protein